jgi:FkbM family methyltransferase
MKTALSRFMKSLSWQVIRSGQLPAELPYLQKLQEHVYLLSMINNLKIDCVIDVGANKGFYAQHLRRGGFKGQIVCFEPIKTNCEEITRRARGDALWKIVNVALGAEESVRSFNVIQSENETVLSSFLNMKGQITATVENIVIQRLDDILPKILPEDERRRVFLKMDTQGFDLEVFRGSAGILDSIVGLQSEISVQPLYEGMPHYTDALLVYEGAGFKIMNLFVVNRTPEGAVLEYDCLMARDNNLTSSSA